MSSDRLVRIWALVALHADGAQVSVAHACSAAVTAVGVDGAGVTVAAGPTRQETMHSTDPVAATLEELQLTLGQGPCVDTFASGPVLVDDLDTTEYLTRWPAFTPAALDAGAAAVFALPLQVGAIQLGVLDLYRSRPGGLEPQELADALGFADTVGVLLLDAAAGINAGTGVPAWYHEDTSGNQAVVHQATGMVLAQLGVGADAAFARLRAYAYAHNRRLGDVARDVVERRLRFEPDLSVDPPP